MRTTRSAQRLTLPKRLTPHAAFHGDGHQVELQPHVQSALAERCPMLTNRHARGRRWANGSFWKWLLERCPNHPVIASCACNRNSGVVSVHPAISVLVIHTAWRHVRHVARASPPANSTNGGPISPKSVADFGEVRPQQMLAGRQAVDAESFKNVVSSRFLGSPCPFSFDGGVPCPTQAKRVFLLKCRRLCFSFWRRPAI